MLFEVCIRKLNPETAKCKWINFTFFKGLGTKWSSRFGMLLQHLLFDVAVVCYHSIKTGYVLSPIRAKIDPKCCLRFVWFAELATFRIACVLEASFVRCVSIYRFFAAERCLFVYKIASKFSILWRYVLSSHGFNVLRGMGEAFRGELHQCYVGLGIGVACHEIWGHSYRVFCMDRMRKIQYFRCEWYR